MDEVLECLPQQQRSNKKGKSHVAKLLDIREEYTSIHCSSAFTLSICLVCSESDKGDKNRVG
jgi:hypothetical protein